jgi:hypothetical protein
MVLLEEMAAAEMGQMGEPLCPQLVQRTKAAEAAAVQNMAVVIK